MADPDAFDSKQLEEAKRQVLTLMRGVADLSQVSRSADEFYPEFLEKLMFALGAKAGAVWRVQAKGGFILEYRANLAGTQLLANERNLERHARLLTRVSLSKRALAVAPGSSDGSTTADETAADNPTAMTILLCPIVVGGSTIGVVEFFQSGTFSPSVLQGQLQFLTHVTLYAVDFRQGHKARELAVREQLWRQVERFTGQESGSLDPRLVANLISNEGPGRINCDRISVATCQDGRWRLADASGPDRVERRAHCVRLLEQLVAVAAAEGEWLCEWLWHTGDEGQLPPRLRDALRAYLHESPAKFVAIVPLLAPPPPGKEGQPTRDSRPVKKRETIGAVVVERFS